MPKDVEVFLFALITALATGLGALPFFFVRSIPRRYLGVSNAIAAGFMTAASFGLIIEGVQHSQFRTWTGAVLGILLIALFRRTLQGHDVTWGDLDAKDAVKVMSVLAIMTVHSFTEGVGVGVSFGGGMDLGLYITTAISIHNIPEGLAISLVMIPRGTTATKAAGWSVFSSLPQPLMAVPAFMLVEWFRPLLAGGLGFAAGAMLWMVGVELVPEAVEESSKQTVTAVFVASAVAMGVFQLLL